MDQCEDHPADSEKSQKMSDHIPMIIMTEARYEADKQWSDETYNRASRQWMNDDPVTMLQQLFECDGPSSKENA